MSVQDILAISWEGLSNNKMRALLTMLGVIIGVAAVIIMMAISAGTEATIAEQINSLGANLVFVSSAGTKGGPGGSSSGVSLTYQDAIAIGQRTPGVAGYSVEMNTSQTLRHGAISIDDVEICGTTPDFPSVREVGVAKGHFFDVEDVEQEARVAVLGPTLAYDLFGNTSPLGQEIIVGTNRLTVIGVTEAKGYVGSSDWDSRLYMPISVIFSRYEHSVFDRMTGNAVQTVFIQAEPDASLVDTMLQIELLLAKRHDTDLDSGYFTVQTQQDIIDTRESTTAAFRSLLAWVAGVSLLVGGIGIMNIMLVSVTERTREIGIRQSVGATARDIRWQFLSEALMLSLVGGLIGVSSGVGGSWLFGQVGGMRTEVVPASIILAFGSAALVGIFFGFYPANRAAQLDPIEALRHE